MEIFTTTETLIFSEGEFLCDETYDSSQDCRNAVVQETASMPRKYVLALIDEEISEFETLKTCRDLISKDLIQIIALRNQDNQILTVYGNHSLFGVTAFIKKTIDALKPHLNKFFKIQQY